jgi:branched-chain amino acid transport system ATP-binding protein
MTILRLSGVHKSFGALQVAQDITFDVPQGQALGIIGPNGAGKSTLFNLITGNIDPNQGRIEFLGRDITKTPPMQRTLMGMGRSFQIPQPFDNISVFENVLVAACFGQNISESVAIKQCAYILDQTEMMHLANMPASKLSLLERKRLELARAMATHPKLLMLDEIAGGLTDAECLSLIETIKSIHASGVTIIWIEHVLLALTSVVEQLLVLDFGKVIAMGEPQNIMASREVQEIYLGIDA